MNRELPDQISNEVVVGNQEEISSGNGIKIQGFIDIELVNEKEHYTKTYHNTITKGGKQFLLAHSAASMLNMSASKRGNALVSSALINQDAQNRTDYNSYYCLTNMLLFLDTLQTGLTESSTFVDLFNTTGKISDTKVVGYASNNIVVQAAGKEGTIDYCKDAYVADGYTVCERWRYPEGVATGKIDTIAMAPAGWSGGGLGGQRFSKCLDKVNLQSPNYISYSKMFCPPGIPGYTSDDELLLDYSQDLSSRHKYTISTGVITDNPTNWFVFPENTTDMVKIGNYIYTFRQNYIDVFLISNMSKVASFSINNGYNTNDRLIVDKTGTLWISSQYDASGGTNVYYTLQKCSKTGDYFNAVSNKYNDFTQLFTVPTALDIKNVNFGMCGSNYVMYVKQNNFSSGYNRVSTAIIFTNQLDILGSIIDIIPEVQNTSFIFSTATSYGILDTLYYNQNTEGKDANNRYRIIKNKSKEANIYANGLWLTMKGWYSTLFSFVKLTTPITKLDTDIMYVSYGYKIV